MKLSEFIDEFGIKKFDVENWLKRETMRTEYASTSAPVPRVYSRANVVELAMTSALVAVGAKPSTAIATAEIIVDDYRIHGHARRRWLVFPASAFTQAFQMTELDPARLEEIAAESPHGTVVMIDAKSIVDRVDTLFERAHAVVEV